MNTQPALEAASAAATMPMAAAEATPPATSAAPLADAPPPAGPPDGVQPQPHIQILRTVPIGLSTQQAAQPSAPATQVAPAAQSGSTTAVSNATSTGDAAAVPSNTGSDAKNAASAVHNAGPDAEGSGSDDAQQKPAPGLADTIATLQPTEMFFLVAVGLSMVVFLIVIASRIAAKRREPIITDYRDAAWSNDRSDLPRVDNTRFADEAMDEEWIDEEQDVPRIDPQGVDGLHEQDWTERPLPARSNRRKSASSAAPSGPDPKGFGPVLRILRQA